TGVRAVKRCHRCLAFAVALLALAPTRADQPEPKAKSQPKGKTDLELIQGTWQIVALEAGGKPEPERNYKWNSFTFSRDKSNDKAVLREVGHLPTDFTFKLDPIPTPKTIDLTTKTGITLRGIYKLEGDDLTVCLSVGSSRPTEFATKAGGDTETFTLKRSKW